MICSQLIIILCGSWLEIIFSGKISSKESLLDTGKKNIGSCYLDAGAQPPCLLDFTEKCGCGITSGTSMQEDQPVE